MTPEKPDTPARLFLWNAIVAEREALGGAIKHMADTGRARLGMAADVQERMNETIANREENVARLVGEYERGDISRWLSIADLTPWPVVPDDLSGEITRNVRTWGGPARVVFTLRSGRDFDALDDAIHSVTASRTAETERCRFMKCIGYTAADGMEGYRAFCRGHTGDEGAEIVRIADETDVNTPGWFIVAGGRLWGQNRDIPYAGA